MILSIASQKGGTGKTTTAITLATGLGRLGQKVLLIDIDSQANASKVIIPNYIDLRKDETIYATILDRFPLQSHKTEFPNVEIIPSHILLSDTDIELTTAKDHREARLKNELDKVKNQYNYVLIDCPPALSWLTINAFTASDKVLVVIAPGYFELDSVKQINKTMQEVKELFNPKLKLAGYLFTMSDPTINSRTSLKLLRQTYTDAVLKTIIPRNTDLRDAHFNKEDIFTHSPKSKGAEAYKKLIGELFGYEKEIK
ncbi:MAG: ParA family protein [Anaerolineales bacterium]|jgi:chromosome partitioning protein